MEAFVSGEILENTKKVVGYRMSGKEKGEHIKTTHPSNENNETKQGFGVMIKLPQMILLMEEEIRDQLTS